MDIPVYKELEDFLLDNFPDARKASGGKEIVMRCRFCGDSRDIKSKHLYISLGYDNKPPMFNCFKCNEQGLLRSNKIKMLAAADSVYSTVVGHHVDGYINTIYKDPTMRRKLSSGDIFFINNNYINDNIMSQAKLKYINNRLGLEFGYNDLLENKIVLNCFDIFSSNNITTYSRDFSIVEELNNSFIGFLSLDNGYINMRNLRRGKVNKFIDTKYVNYNIFNSEENGKRYYVIPSNINMSNPNPIRIHIAEGPFDILSVKYNLRRGMDNTHDIFAAICGKAYLNILKLFISQYGLMNIEVHLYMDNDIDSWIYKVIKDNLGVFNFNIFIHQNKFKGEKDFGVPIDRINEYVYKL